jgi:hypothetical protein
VCKLGFLSEEGKATCVELGCKGATSDVDLLPKTSVDHCEGIPVKIYPKRKRKKGRLKIRKVSRFHWEEISQGQETTSEGGVCFAM